jgi:hypothetical protein
MLGVRLVGDVCVSRWSPCEPLVLEIKSLVVHFQGLCISFLTLRDGQPIRELKLEGVNHRYKAHITGRPSHHKRGGYHLKPTSRI